MENLIKKYVSENTQDMYSILKEICAIPAPTGLEQKRAEYCKNWLETNGAKGVYIDEVSNVIFPLNCEGSDEITVFAAHMDTVFPETEPHPYYDDGEKIHCPSVSDDSASLAHLLLMAKFMIENNITPKKGILFVFNSCEEGLGNLEGTKQLFKQYANRIKNFISFDCNIDTLYDRCVGSDRYEVTATTVGGHSFGDFGNANAICALSKIIEGLYKIEVPERPGSVVTCNVGTINGGTAIGAIAQNATMFCEYRSNNKECLDDMKEKFDALIDSVRSDEVKIEVNLLDERPCSITSQDKVEELKKIVLPIIEEVIGKKVAIKMASTDCNVPLSLGVPGLGVGLNMHGGVHTYEEWVDKKSMIAGFEIALKLGLAFS